MNNYPLNVHQNNPNQNYYKKKNMNRFIIRAEKNGCKLYVREYYDRRKTSNFGPFFHPVGTQGIEQGCGQGYR